VVTDGASCRPITCPGFVQGANLVMAALNSLYGGHDGVSRRPILSAAHGRAHARIACKSPSRIAAAIQEEAGLHSWKKPREVARRWRRWLCGPPVKVKGLTDVVAGDAKLPQDMRCRGRVDG